jgi:uncharacterized membrane protein YhaH (DUF805 family)
MKCPSCGYENKEDARYCNLCQTSFIKPQPESFGLAPPLVPRKDAVSGGGATDLNWFQRHLNWTWLLPQVFLYITAVIFLYKSLTDMFGALISSSESAFYSAATTWISFWFVWPVMVWAAEFGIGAWVLRRKKRSLWWLSIFFVPTPLAWFAPGLIAIVAYIIVVIVFLCLNNESELRRVTVSNPAMPSLEVQRLKSQSEKYGP